MVVKMWPMSLLVISLVGLTTTGTAVQVNRFSNFEICGDFSDLYSQQCLSSPTNSSKLSCVIKCARNSSCLGVLYHGFHHACHFLIPCDFFWNNLEVCETQNFSQVYMKGCQNGFEYSEDERVLCACEDGWVGYFCERRATGCQDLRGFGYQEDTELLVFISYFSRLLSVLCRFGSNYHSIGLFSSTGAYNRTQSWSAYKAGYFINRYNYWLGLDNMHYMTSDDSLNSFVKGMIHFKGTESSDFDDYYTTIMEYHGFTVLDEWNGYAYSFDQLVRIGANTPAQDCLNATQFVYFSTWDNDYDNDVDINCAQMASVGWWIDRCDPTLPCNLLGMTKDILPPPRRPAHIDIKDFDMLQSNIYSNTFRNVEFRLVKRF